MLSTSAFARQLSKRLVTQPNARILLSRALVAAHPIIQGESSSSCSVFLAQRRCQSSHALTSAPATRGASSSGGKDNVKPWLRQYRPQINGRSVAFHVNDLLKQQNAAPTVTQQDRAAEKREYESDLVVILDMDECMIHSQFLSSPTNAQVYAHQLQRQRRDDPLNGTPVDHFRVDLPSGDLVHVNVRPGLMDFLDQVTERYETHVFTAAMSVYARPVLDQLDPEGTKFSQVWYREHCRYDAQQHAYLKDLEALAPALDPTKLGRTVLVDNNPLSFMTHPSNGILVSSFYNDAQDNTLPAVWNLLQELESYDDVRPVLDARFGLKNALLVTGQQQQQAQAAEKKTKSTTSTPPLPIQQQAAATACTQQQVAAV